MYRNNVNFLRQQARAELIHEQSMRKLMQQRGLSRNNAKTKANQYVASYHQKQAKNMAAGKGYYASSKRTTKKKALHVYLAGLVRSKTPPKVAQVKIFLQKLVCAAAICLAILARFNPNIRLTPKSSQHRLLTMFAAEMGHPIVYGQPLTWHQTLAPVLAILAMLRLALLSGRQQQQHSQKNMYTINDMVQILKFIEKAEQQWVSEKNAYKKALGKYKEEEAQTRKSLDILEEKVQNIVSDLSHKQHTIFSLEYEVRAARKKYNAIAGAFSTKSRQFAHMINALALVETNRDRLQKEQDDAEREIQRLKATLNAFQHEKNLLIENFAKTRNSMVQKIAQYTQTEENIKHWKDVLHKKKL